MTDFGRRVKFSDIDSLETALAKWLATLFPDWPANKVTLVGERLGWGVERPPSLAAASVGLGLTAERFRQVEKEARNQLTAPPASITALIERCWDAFPNLPGRWTRIRARLREVGIINEGIDPAELARLGQLVGMQPTVLYRSGYLVGRDGDVPPVALAVERARARARAAGVCNCDSLLAELEWSDRWESDDLMADLAEAGLAGLESGWICHPGAPRDRLANLTRKMLTACGSLQIDDLMDGLVRQVRVRRLPELPPRTILLAYLRRHPDFAVEGNTVRVRGNPLPETELALTERTLWRALQSSGKGVLTREELRNAAVNAGIDVHTFSAALTYSPIIAQASHGRWRLRGDTRASSSPKERAVPARPTRVMRFYWKENGQLTVSGVMGSAETTVLAIPAAVQPMVEGRDFEGVDAEGNLFGTVRVVNGRALGFTAFLDSRPRQRDDVLTASFDLVNGRCVVGIVGRDAS